MRQAHQKVRISINRFIFFHRIDSLIFIFTPLQTTASFGEALINDYLNKKLYFSYSFLKFASFELQQRRHVFRKEILLNIIAWCLVVGLQSMQFTTDQKRNIAHLNSNSQMHHLND